MGVVIPKANRWLRLPLALQLHLLYSPCSPRVQRSTAGFIVLMRSVCVAVYNVVSVCACRRANSLRKQKVTCDQSLFRKNAAVCILVLPCLKSGWFYLLFATV